MRGANNLPPNSMLEKTYQPSKVEGRIYAEWERSGAFRAGRKERVAAGAEPYCIVIPPPNVTGSLHMGHALNNTLQDILVRFERMRGRDVLWQPGTDHAGIATQMVVERKLAEEGAPDRRALGREAFLERVWAWKEESGGTIINQLKRLGASCDWSRERFTMDEGLSRAVLKVFVELYRQGLIYKDKRLVNWDPKFETAISDLEVENVEVDGRMWHFKYPLADGASYTYVERDADGRVVFEEERDWISIATTRPETMLGDGAVAVHPSDARYAPIVGKLCEIPVGPKELRRKIPIITDDYPDPEFGSGAVKITGAHDFNDYQVARRNGIPLYSLMDARARMRSDGLSYEESARIASGIAEGRIDPDDVDIDAINLVPEHLRGLDRYEAREKVIAEINAEGLAVMVADESDGLKPLVEHKKIMQPVGDRSKVVIEPMLTDQWFVKAEVLAKPALKAVREGRTVFVPKNWEKTYFDWLENIEPWCISRQLWWGHRIPAWYGPDGAIFVAENEKEARAQARAHYGKKRSPKLRRDEDVLDTWFSSALWPFSTLGWPDETPELARYYPTDVLVTGFDIIFFWVARMMMMGLHFMKEIPFHTVYIHALVRDEKGQKMSKSKGNVMDPLELIDEFGADALRFTLAAMAAQGRDIKLAKSRVAGYRNFATKLWNAARFAEMNECVPLPDFDPGSARLTINRWIAGALTDTIEAVTRALEEYRFNEAAGNIYHFTWGTFCDWYLELAKPVLAGSERAALEETRAMTAWVLDGILKLLHPFMPFITEELWAHMATHGTPRETPLILADWPVADAGLRDNEAAAEIEWLIRLVTEVRSVRSEMNVPAAARVPLVLVGAGDETRARAEKYNEFIRRLARAESLTHAETAPPGSVQIVLGEAVLALPLAGVINLEAESARLKREIEKAQSEAKKLAKKLANKQFTAKAPPHVVEAQRERMAEAEAMARRLAAALARVEGME